MSEPVDSTFLAKIRRLDLNAFKDRVEDVITSKSPPFLPKPVAPVTQEVYKDNFRLSEEKVRLVADVAHYKSVITVFQSKIDEKDASIQSLAGTVTSLTDKCKTLNSQLRDALSQKDAALELVQETQTRLTGVEGDLQKSNTEVSYLKAHNELLAKEHAAEVDLVRTQRGNLQDKLDSTGNALQEESANVFKLSQYLEDAKFEMNVGENKRAKLVTELVAALDELTEVKARLVDETGEKTRLQAELKAALDIIAQQNILIKQKDDALVRMQDDVEAAKEKSASVLEELREKFEVAEDQIVGMKSKLATLSMELAASNSLVDSLTVELGNKNAELQRRSEEVDQHKAEIEVLRVDAVAKEKELGETRDKLKGVEGQLDRAQMDCANLDALLTERDATIGLTMERCKSVEGEFAAYREKAEKDAQYAKDIIESLNAQIRISQEEKENTLVVLSSVRLELNGTKAQLDDARERNLSLSDELLKQQDTLENTTAELSKVQICLKTASNDLNAERVSHHASNIVAEEDIAKLSSELSQRDETIARLSEDKEVTDQKIAQLVQAKEVLDKKLSDQDADMERFRRDATSLQEKLKRLEDVPATPGRTTLPTPAPTPPPVVASLPSTPTKPKPKNPPTPVSDARLRAPRIQSQFIRTLVLNQAKSNNIQSGVVPKENANTPPTTPPSAIDTLPSGESSSSVQDSPVPSTPTPEAKTGRRRRRNRHFNRKKKQNGQASGAGSSLN